MASWKTELPLLIAGHVTSGVGALVLFGWATGVRGLVSYGPGHVTAKVNTALGFVLGGAALVARTRSRVRVTALGTAAALVVVGLAVATLVEYGSGWDLGIDQLLAHGGALDARTSHPGSWPVSAISTARTSSWGCSR